MNAPQMFALETFLEGNYFTPEHFASLTVDISLNEREGIEEKSEDTDE